MTKTIAACISLTLFSGALATAATGDAAAIRSTRAAQNKAIAAGDLDRASAFWTDDVTVRRALGQPMSGRAEVSPSKYRMLA